MNTQTEQSTKRMDEQRHYTYINDCGVWRVGHYEWSSIQFAHDGSWDEHYVFVTHTEFEHEHDESDAIALCNKLNGVGVWRDVVQEPQGNSDLLVLYEGGEAIAFRRENVKWVNGSFMDITDPMRMWLMNGITHYLQLPPLPQPENRSDDEG